MVTLNEGATPRTTYKDPARETAEAIPGHDFSFLPADIVSQILNFGSPSPLDVQIAGSDLNASRAIGEQTAREDPARPGVADPRIQQAFKRSLP